MEHLSTTPCVSVTIGRHTRQYFAFVTTAPDVVDSPATLTLQHGPFREVIAFASAPIPLESMRRTTARLVLVDAMELAWQRANCIITGGKQDSPSTENQRSFHAALRKRQ